MSSIELENSLSEEKELDTEGFEKQSRSEMDSIKEKTNETNEIRKCFLHENKTKITNYSGQTNDNNDSMYTSKISSLKTNSLTNLDKLQRYKYYYPDFNFKSLNNRLPSSRQLKNGIFK